MYDGIGEHPSRTFESVCKRYYPNWHDAGNWRVISGGPAVVCPGRCVPTEKIIEVYPPFPGFTLEHLLIHEIAHAITGGEHREAFVKEILRVSVLARELGDVVLADSIVEEITELQTAETEPPPDQNQVSAAFDDVLMALGDVSFEEALPIASQYIGLSVIEMLREFPDARALYAEAREISGYE